MNQGAGADGRCRGEGLHGASRDGASDGVSSTGKPLEKIQQGKIAKGDVLSVAQVAGVMGAKRTPDLIPMCHPILLTSVDISSFHEVSQPNDQGRCSITITATAKTKCSHGRGDGNDDGGVGGRVDDLDDMYKAVDRG